MRQVIESNAESGDGVSIEREQPSTAFQPMGVFAKLDGITGKPDPQGDLAVGELGGLELVHQDGQTYFKGPGGQLLGPISGEGVFKPQDIDSKGSVIWGDNHFKPGADGDSITDGSRPMNIWGNGGASTFSEQDQGVIAAAVNEIRSENRFVIEHFEPLAGMYSFAETHLPVHEDEGFQPLEGASVEIGEPPEPKLWLQMLG